MWTAILGKPRMLPDGQVVTPCTLLSDSGQKVGRELFGTDPASAARAAVASLNAASEFISGFKAGEVAPVPPPVPAEPPAPPTPDPKVVAFQAAVEKVRQTQRAVDLGVLTATDLATAKADAKKLYLPEYLGLL